MSITEFEVAVAIVRRDDRWLVALRREGDHLGGMWEFPGGKRRAGETIAEAALRELREECGVSGSAERVLAPVTHHYDTRRVEITPVLCRYRDGDAQPLASSACNWVTWDELAHLKMPAANALILRSLCDEVQ